MRCGQIAPVDLGVTCRAIRVESRAKLWNRIDIYPVTTTVCAVAVPNVASQAEERRRLFQQVVRHRPMGLVADAAIFRHWRMLVSEWSLFVGMALPT